MAARDPEWWSSSSPAARRVLATLVAEPTRDDWFPLDLCRRTRLGGGTMLRVLFRLEQLRWIESRWEETGDRRPRRRLYRLTGLGQRVARQHVWREAGSTRLRWSPL